MKNHNTCSILSLDLIQGKAQCSKLKGQNAVQLQGASPFPWEKPR